jgi:hypothetical protein
MQRKRTKEHLNGTWTQWRTRQLLFTYRILKLFRYIFAVSMKTVWFCLMLQKRNFVWKLFAGNIVLKCYCCHNVYGMYLYMFTGFIRNKPNYSKIAAFCKKRYSFGELRCKYNERMFLKYFFPILIYVQIL